MNYWELRKQKQREALYKKAVEQTNKELARQYARTLKVVKNKMLNLFDEINASGADVAINDIYSFNRYYELVNALTIEMDKLGTRQVKSLEPKLEKLYTKTSEEVADEFGLNSKVNTEAARQAVNQIWCSDGKHWSERIWNDKKLLATKLEECMIDAVSRGAPRDELVSSIMTSMNVSYNNANRLIRTELTNVQNQATLERYKEAGITKYEFLAEVGDGRCCDKCRKLNGKQFSIDAAIVGVNFPVMHPNCRCTTLAVIKGGKK